MSTLIARATPKSPKVLLIGKIYKSGYLGSKSNSTKPHVIHFDRVRKLSTEASFMHLFRQILISTVFKRKKSIFTSSKK